MRQVYLVLFCLSLQGCVRLPPPRMAIVQNGPALNCRSVESTDRIHLTWVSPADPHGDGRLDAWCRSVGPALMSSVDVVVQEAESLAVVTWNTNVGAGHLRFFIGTLRTGEFTGGVPVGNFVLLLQEVRRHGTSVPELPAGFQPPRRLGPAPGEATPGADTIDSTDIAEIARSLGLNLAYAPAMRNGATREDRGNAILSSLPLDDVTVIELPMERQRRVAIAATVRAGRRDGGSGSLRVVSVHLETRVSLLRGSPAAARRRQAHALIDALSSSSLPTVIAGDLNTSWGDDEPAVKDLMKTFPDARLMRGATWRGRVGLSAKLDYVFARIPGQHITVDRIRDRFGSDHHPLVAVIHRSETKFSLSPSMSFPVRASPR